MSQSEFHDKIRKLLDAMTFAEKVGQMTQVGTSIYSPDMKLDPEVAEEIRKARMGSFLSVTGIDMMNEMQHIAVEETRLGIPLFFAHDIIHGYRTVFPVPLAESCSFEPELAKESARHIAEEARSNGFHLTFAPMVDIARDPRWGRGYEGAGEDTVLSSAFAKARVEGFQNGDLSQDRTIAACAKHFVGYGAVRGGRDYNSVDLGDNSLYNDHLPPFRTAVDAGVEFVMTAFHDLDGVPCTANPKLLQEILRKELGFEGIIISDANSLRELQNHGFAGDTAETAQKGLSAGLDMEMAGMGETQYLEGLEPTPENLTAIDRAVYRILDFKFRLGLFEKPYIDAELAASRTATQEASQAARNAARRSLVLLENNGVLPIRNKKVAVIGGLAADREFSGGGWVVADPAEAYAGCVTILEGIKGCPAFFDVTYAPGYTYPRDNEALIQKSLAGDYCFFETNDSLIAQAVTAAKESDVVLLVAGEHPCLCGEAKSRMDLSLPGAVMELLAALEALGKPIVMYVGAGRPLLIGAVKDRVDGLLFSYHLGSQAGNGLADVLSGAYNPSAKLASSIPSANGQGPNVYYAHNRTGKPYRPDSTFTSRYIDGPNEPAYCFGFGKGYTEFSYENLCADKSEFTFGETISLSVGVKNRGTLDGEAVVQVYLQDVSASLARPVRQLIAFQKVKVCAGEMKTVAFLLDTNGFGFYKDRRYTLEPGKFLLYAGGDSDARMSLTVTGKGQG